MPVYGSAVNVYAFAQQTHLHCAMSMDIGVPILVMQVTDLKYFCFRFYLKKNCNLSTI